MRFVQGIPGQQAVVIIVVGVISVRSERDLVEERLGRFEAGYQSFLEIEEEEKPKEDRRALDALDKAIAKRPFAQKWRQPEVTLVTDELLPAHVGRVRRLLERAMDLHGLSQLVHRRVVAVEPGVVGCEPSGRVEADLVVWVTGAGAAPWLANSGVQTDPDGFVTVNACLQSPSHPFVFATGDAASLASGPVPKSGVSAVRQGPPLAENLRRALDGRHLLPYRKQRLALPLISTGGRHAVASYGPLAASGRWVWLWKDRIDRAFVQRYAV